MNKFKRKLPAPLSLLVRAASAPDVVALDPIRLEASQTLQRIDSLFSDIDPDVSLALITPLSHLRKNLIGTSSIISLHQAELVNIEEGRQLTVENSTISAQLSDAVAALVSNSQAAITDATARTEGVQRLRTTIGFTMADRGAEPHQLGW